MYTLSGASVQTFIFQDLAPVLIASCGPSHVCVSDSGLLALLTGVGIRYYPSHLTGFIVFGIHRSSKPWNPETSPDSAQRYLLFWQDYPLGLFLSSRHVRLKDKVVFERYLR